jgi:hypothetical protein
MTSLKLMAHTKFGDYGIESDLVLRPKAKTDNSLGQRPRYVKANNDPPTTKAAGLGWYGLQL